MMHCLIILKLSKNLPNLSRFLYSLKDKTENKMEIIAKEIFGADGIKILPAAAKQLNMYEKQGFGELPICMAKTQYSLSDDPTKKGAPKGQVF